MIGLVSATPAGERLARHLAEVWPEARCYRGPLRETLPLTWAECAGIVAFCATGIAARLTAPLLGDKRTDPALVCVDDAARFAVALLGGHHGANALAHRAAETLGSVPVVTTASDALALPALEDLGSELGFRIEERSDLAGVAAALGSGEEVTFTTDRPWPLGPLPPGVRERDSCEPPCLLVTDRLGETPRPAVVYRPPSLVLGVGASRGVAREEILELADATLQAAGLSPLSVAAVATVEAKADETGSLEAAAARGWPIRTHPAERLAARHVPNPSAIVERAVGTPSVAEAAVLAEGAELCVPKHRSAMATVAVGRLPVRGRLHIVGAGPGHLRAITPEARDLLARSAVVVGLERYVDQVRPLLQPGTRVLASAIGDEVARAELACAEAQAGRAVALVSGGDAGVYGMASPAIERARDIDVVCAPGVTAAQAAAARLGAPLAHDHCAISLSDLLTPWDEIRRRIEAAAVADLVVVFYNPRSRRRTHQIEEARSILLGHRPATTPTGIVTDAYRPDERIELTTLADLDTSGIGMTTTVVVGSSRTRMNEGLMVTPRGYA